MPGSIARASDDVPADIGMSALATPAPAEVAVVIVAHDSGAFLSAAVRSVLAQSVPVQVIVVDNASRDGSIDTLPHDPRLRVLRNADNRGFGKACNQGAAHSSAPLLLFLNPDCELPAGALAALCETIEAHGRIGLLGAQLLDTNGAPQAASRRQTPRPAHAIRVAMGLARPEPAPPFAQLTALADAPEIVEATSGALMLLPRRLFEQLGGFDEGYVLHCEDLDLCRRVLAAGCEVAIAPQVRVPHHKGTSSRRRPVWVEWQKHRGMLRYFRKFDAEASPWWLRVLVPIGVWARFPIAAARAWRNARRPLPAQETSGVQR